MLTSDITACVACGGPVPEGARFCPSCGRPVAVGVGGEERKLATVLFADLTGSTELAVRLDAEQLRSLLADVYEQLSLAASAFGGTVEKFIGDAIMAIFGVPVAHEDDPERAIRAALTMRSRMATVARQHDVEALLRIGITTGMVVTGTTPGRDFLVTGESVNLAARLQQAAEPGEILIGERTFRAVQALVRTVAPRSLAVKGQGGPVLAYAIEGIAPSSVYRRRRAPGPFVGRAGELSLISTLCERAVEHRRSHLVTVVGEPGIGKSRLAEELVIDLQTSPEPPQLWICRCRPYGEGGAYEPLIEPLLRSAAVPPTASLADIRRQAAGELQALLGEDAESVVQDVLRSAGLVADAPAEDEGIDLARRARDAWRSVLVELAERAPLLLVVEDAQWAEPALLDLIETLAGSDLRSPLIVLCLARDELLQLRPEWGARSRNATVLALDAIGDGEMRRLAAGLSAHEVGDRSIELAGGNPFFLEEILAIHDESGGGGLMPETVQGVIAARLDLLPAAEKAALQRAAVIGRPFDQETLAAVGSEISKTALAGLSGRELLVPLGERWGFKHVLIRDVAYESISRAERSRLHLQFARWLEEQGRVDAQVVAAHYATAAELGERSARQDAVRLLLAAAREARGVYAHGLGLRQAERALGLADDDHQRAQAWEAMGDAHWMAERIERSWECYTQALEYGVAVGLDHREMAVLRWKWVDIPTRWFGLSTTRLDVDRVDVEIDRGLDDARLAGHEVVEARLLTARAFLVWRVEREAEPQERALELADRALEIADRRRLARVASSARDARSVLLQALYRYEEARENDEARFALLDELNSREEQMDLCASVSRTRSFLGDYKGAVDAIRRAEELAARDDPRWLVLPGRSMIEAFFLWDRWDEAMEAYERYLPIFRRGEFGRRSGLLGIASGVAAGIHLLRGERERAERIEQRQSERTDGFDLLFAQALLGAGEPEMALDRLSPVRTPRFRVAALRAEAQAALEDWDALEKTLAWLAEFPQHERLPRVLAQVERARGIAGDELALERGAVRFRDLGCRFEHARCLELMGRDDRARKVFEQLGVATSGAR